MSPEFIFVMKDLRKVVPPNREILKGIWLSFFFGAKIGVIGANGAGKSSLLRIMAAQDPSFLGEAFPAKGIKVGFLPQEPRLDPGKTVLGNVEEGVAGTRALLDRFNAISERLGEPLDPDAMEKLLEEQAAVQDRIDAANAWELDRGPGIPWEGNYSSWLDQKKARLAQEEKAESARQRSLARELDWVRMAPRARHAKSKARVSAYEKLLAEEAERAPESVEIYIP